MKTSLAVLTVVSEAYYFCYVFKDIECQHSVS